MLRLCVLRVEGIFTINKEAVGGVTNIKPRLEGGIGRHNEYFLDSFWFEGLNYTAQEVEFTQKCVTSISTNESDYMPTTDEFPVNEDYNKVNPFIVTDEGKIVMAQAYNRTDPSNMKTDIFITSISGLNWQVWLTLAFLLSSFAFLLKIRQWFLKKPFLSPRRLDLGRKWINYRDEETSDAFFHVISAFCQQASKEYNDSFLGSITFWIYMSSFFVITMYFCNVMSTDMIVVNKPDVVENYDELFKKGYIIPTFNKQLTDYKRFEDAIEGSREFMFWENMKKKYQSEDWFADPRGSSFMDGLMSVYTRRRLIMITDGLQEAARTTACKLKMISKQPRILTYASVDPESQIFAKGLVIRKSDNAIIKRIIKKMRPPIEMGLNVYTNRETSKGLFPEDLLPEDPPDMHDCMSDTLVIEDPGFQAASPKNFKSIVQVCLFLVLVAKVCLVCEIIIKKCRRRRS